MFLIQEDLPSGIKETGDKEDYKVSVVLLSLFDIEYTKDMLKTQVNKLDFLFKTFLYFILKTQKSCSRHKIISLTS